MRYYPVFLDLAGQPCIVLGEGKFAIEKAAALREAGADVRVVPSREYRTGDLAGARLVVDASEDVEVNRRSWQEAEEAGILINVVDRPAQCRFIAPAIVRRDPLLIAISTSGESPYLASALRARIERWLGREWGPFTALVGNIRRQLRERGMPIAEQTRIYRRIAGSDARSLIRDDRFDDAAHLAVSIAQTGGTGRVGLVGAGPGDPDLLTFKARELLADADYVLHDALIARETLALCGPDARLEDVGKRAGLDNPRQEAITSRLIELARAGNNVVRLKGGDPFVFGRGGEELAGLVEAGVEVIVVPGVTAALAAPAAAGISVTQRGVAASVAITTAQGGGSLDRLRELAVATDTLVVLMPRAGLAEVAAVLSRAVGGSRPAAVISNATLPNQRSISGPLDRIAQLADQARIETPATLVVGDVVAAAPALAVLPNSFVDGGFG
jgi:uroporphyrin-III C-methyltransferase/precorrin-2 dehydrogenase/sirohydrochlorin ferrochelatase